MKPAPQPSKNVLLILGLAYASHRDLLHGISLSTSPRNPWRISIVDYSTHGSVDNIRSTLATGKIDGVVASSATHSNVAVGLQNWEGPLVAIASPGTKVVLPLRKTPITLCGIDDMAVGQRGAEYLTSLGRFKAFGFISDSNSPHNARLTGFCNYFAARGRNALVYSGDITDNPKLGEWLASLPKPAAVMVIRDNLAIRILSVAQQLGIRVPENLSVLGVDNDETLCEASTPTLSSIAPNHIRLGEIIGNALEESMKHPASPAGNRFISDIKVVERQSTKPISLGVALARRAMEYIRRNATRGISSADVINFLAVSRSLAYQRFEETYGTSIGEAIIMRRIAEAKRRLRETSAPISRIARLCGFGADKHAMRLFKSRTGMTMRQWRIKENGKI